MIAAHKSAVTLSQSAARLALSAQALYSTYTQRKYHDVYEHVKALHSSKDKVFLKAEPWFEGNAIIQGEGFWLDQDTFLLLNIDGLSNPKGPLITIERRRHSADEGAAGEFRAYRKPPPQEASNEIIDLIDSEAPDSRIYSTIFKAVGSRPYGNASR